MVDPFGWIEDGIFTEKWGRSAGFFGTGEKIE